MASASLISAQSAPSGTLFLHGFEVSINGSAPTHFGIDTGTAWDFIIDAAQSNRLALPIKGHHTYHTSDIHPETESAAADIVQAKTLTVAGHTFAAPVGLAESNHNSSPVARGVLGITLFRDVLLTLDFPHDRLTISDGELPPPNGSDIIAYTTMPDASFKVLQVTPTVPIQLAGQPFSALLDTGARKSIGEIIVPTAIAAKLPLGPIEYDTYVGGALGKKYPGYTAKLKGDLVLGDIVVHNPTVVVSDWLGFIDLAGILNRLSVTIDQRNQRLLITMPPPSPTAEN